MADFHTISLDRKIKAFERASEQANITEGKLILLTEKYYDAALTFARESFTKVEPVSKAVNLQWFPLLEEMWLTTFRVNLTVAVIDDTNGDVIALRGTRVLDQKYNFDASQIENQAFKRMWDMLEYSDKAVKFFETFYIEQAFHFFGFGVRSDYMNKGIGSRLFKVAVDMLRYLVTDPFYIKGETSSIYSSRIYEKNSFQKLYEISYADYLVDGKQLICNTGEHKSFQIWAIKVNE